MGMTNLKEHKTIKKINQKAFDFLSDYIQNNQDLENKEMIKSLINNRVALSSFYMPYLFTFSAFLFNKLKKTEAICISSALYLIELTIYINKNKKEKKTKEKINILTKLAESIIIDNEDIEAGLKIDIAKSIKKMLSCEEIFSVSKDTLKTREMLNSKLRESYINPILSILSLGAIFQSRSEEDMKYLKGYSNNISKLIFILSCKETKKDNQIKKYFNEKDIKSFAEQANEFLNKFQPERMKYLTDFTNQIYYSINQEREAA